MERKVRNWTGAGTRGSLERKCFRAVSQLVAQCQVHTNNTGDRDDNCVVSLSGFIPNTSLI